MKLEISVQNCKRGAEQALARNGQNSGHMRFKNPLRHALTCTDLNVRFNPRIGKLQKRFQSIQKRDQQMHTMSVLPLHSQFRQYAGTSRRDL